jgi:hypothetical protein
MSRVVLLWVSRCALPLFTLLHSPCMASSAVGIVYVLITPLLRPFAPLQRQYRGLLKLRARHFQQGRHGPARAEPVLRHLAADRHAPRHQVRVPQRRHPGNHEGHSAGQRGQELKTRARPFSAIPLPCSTGVRIRAGWYCGLLENCADRLPGRPRCGNLRKYQE